MSSSNQSSAQLRRCTFHVFSLDCGTKIVMPVRQLLITDVIRRILPSESETSSAVPSSFCFAVRVQLAAWDYSPIGQNPNATSGRLHTYFIAADEVTWDYTPKGRNLTGLPHLEGSDEQNSSSRGHRSYLKAIFREYTDATFRTLKPRPPEWEHLGILGPLIRAEVGDTIEVFFKNNTKLTCSMHPHGLSYAKDSEGAMYQDGTPEVARRDDMVPPGGSYTYRWRVPERAGPAPGDGSSVLWMYHGHFVESRI